MKHRCCVALSPRRCSRRTPEIAYDPRRTCSSCPTTSIWARRPAWPPTPRATSSSTPAPAAQRHHAAASRIFTHGGSRLFEFDRTGKFVREIGQGVYGFLFAQAVRVDPQDNIWVVDRGSSMVIKFDPDGRVAHDAGPQARIGDRSPAAAADAGAAAADAGGAATTAARPAPASRRQLQSAHRRRLGRRGQHLRLRRLRQLAHRQVRQERQVHQVLGHARRRARASSTCRTPSPSMPRATCTSPTAATSASRSSTTTATSRRQITNVALRGPSASRPARINTCTAPTPTTPTLLDNGEIYKMELDGKVLGKFGRAGKLLRNSAR